MLGGRGNNRLGDLVIFFFCQNIIIFSLIFWLLTWASEYFYKKKNLKSSKQFYECGFKSISDINLQINVNFAIIVVFLILYDLEFVFLVPIFFNLYNIYFFQIILLTAFIVLIIVSILYDWQMQALSWQY